MKVFTHKTQDKAAIELDKLGWTVFEGGNEIFNDIIQNAKSDSGHNPEGTVLVLISRDDKFVELINELKNNGVIIYIISPPVYNNKLFEVVGQANSIPWSPASAENPKRPIANSFGWLWGVPNN